MKPISVLVGALALALAQAVLPSHGELQTALAAHARAGGAPRMLRGAAAVAATPEAAPATTAAMAAEDDEEAHKRHVKNMVVVKKIAIPIPVPIDVPQYIPIPVSQPAAVVASDTSSTIVASNTAVLGGGTVTGVATPTSVGTTGATGDGTGAGTSANGGAAAPPGPTAPALPRATPAFSRPGERPRATPAASMTRQVTPAPTTLSTPPQSSETPSQQPILPGPALNGGAATAPEVPAAQLRDTRGNAINAMTPMADTGGQSMMQSPGPAGGVGLGVPNGPSFRGNIAGLGGAPGNAGGLGAGMGLGPGIGQAGGNFGNTVNPSITGNLPGGAGASLFGNAVDGFGGASRSGMGMMMTSTGRNGMSPAGAGARVLGADGGSNRRLALANHAPRYWRSSHSRRRHNL